MSFRVAFLALALAASSARADDPAPASAPAKSAAASAFKARVILANGRAWTGVVRVADAWEKRAGGGDWAVCAKADAGAALRLWYVGGRDGFLVLAAGDVKSVENLGALDAAELRGLAEDSSAAEKRAQDERDRLRKAREKRSADAAKDAKSADAGKPPAPDDAAAKAAAELLAKFPPPTWSAARRDEIERRRLIQHVQPTAEERDFVESFGAWAKAMAVATKAAEPKSDDAKAPPAGKPADAK